MERRKKKVILDVVDKLRLSSLKYKCKTHKLFPLNDQKNLPFLKISKYLTPTTLWFITLLQQVVPDFPKVLHHNQE